MKLKMQVPPRQIVPHLPSSYKCCSSVWDSSYIWLQMVTLAEFWSIEEFVLFVVWFIIISSQALLTAVSFSQFTLFWLHIVTAGNCIYNYKNKPISSRVSFHCNQLIFSLPKIYHFDIALNYLILVLIGDWSCNRMKWVIMQNMVHRSNCQNDKHCR